jgi:hypothetical protein
MRRTIRAALLAGALVIGGGVGFGPSSARAHDDGYGGYDAGYQNYDRGYGAVPFGGASPQQPLPVPSGYAGGYGGAGYGDTFGAGYGPVRNPGWGFGSRPPHHYCQRHKHWDCQCVPLPPPPPPPACGPVAYPALPRAPEFGSYRYSEYRREVRTSQTTSPYSPW